MRRRQPEQAKTRYRTPKTKWHCHAHAKRKARERLGLELTFEDLDAIVGMIQQNQAKLIGRESRTRTTWTLEWEGVPMKVVYHKPLRAIVTVLSMDMVARVERRAA